MNKNILYIYFILPVLVLPAGCVHTPTVVPTSELSQRIAPADLGPGYSGGASESAPAPPSEVVEGPRNTPPSGSIAEPSPPHGMAAYYEAPLTLEETKRM